MENEKPIFIIGSERSGTNLLRKLLSNHSNISGPKSPHLINTLYKNQRFYGDLNDRKNLKYLFDDFSVLANHQFTGWNIQLDFDEFTPKSHNVFLELLHWFYTQYALYDKKSKYISKELNAHQVLNELVKLYPKSKFIHLVRNPLEQVASWMRTPIFIYNPKIAIQQWVNTQDEILNLACLYPDNIITVKYEGIVKSTKETVTRILNFVDESIESNCFENKQRQEGHDWNKLWENVNKPVGNNLNKHKEVLSEKDCRLIYAYAGNVMKELGYNVMSNVDYNENKWEKLRLYFYKKRSKKLRKKVKGLHETLERTRFGSNLKKRIEIRHLHNL